MLKLASNAELTQELTTLSTEHPISGSSVNRQIYLYNDNNAFRYENVNVRAIDSTGSDESGWVKFSKDGTNFSDSLTFDEITDTSGKLIHVRVTTQPVQTAQNKQDIKIRVDFREYAK